MTPTGRVFWITGLPASGKSTLAEHLLAEMKAKGTVTLWLDSDDLRPWVTPTATYSQVDRDVFYGVIGHVAVLGAQGGATVVVSATAGRRRYRDEVREEVPDFIEIHLTCPNEVRRQRDIKGLYLASDTGDITSLPGVGSPYEAPERPEITLDSGAEPPERLTARILAWLEANRPKAAS